ncbi:MAG TPA: efflux transporter outer membrane subunit [Candidatus Acidoferrales bacterium]|nr:efflux transporter outer membrane subunit [Candidatus Acidoferrales bacterium]
MRSRILTAFLAASLAGAPAATLPENFRQAGPGVTRDSADLKLWWKQLHDPELDSLIDRAIRNNIELRVAAARVAQARALERVQRSSLFPVLSLSAAFDRIRGGFAQGNVHVDASRGAPGLISPFETNNFQAGLDASWEADIFGANRKAVSASAADARSAEEARRDTLVTVTGEVARAYAELRGIDRRLAITRATIQTQRDTLHLTKVRAEAGLATELDVAQQTTQLSTTQAAEPALLAQRVQTVQRLSVLIGQQPDSLLDELQSAGGLPAVPPVIGAGLPSDLLARRPDVRRAQSDVVAAAARVGAARAELFPKFMITGFAGRQGTTIGGLTLGAGNFFSIGPAVQLPIFTGGRIRANIAVHNAQLEEAQARYEGAMLTALEDVENALSAYAREEERREKLAAAAGASRTAVDLARELYTRGLSDFLSVLDAQRAQYAAEDALAVSQTAIVTDVVALYKALGGGWD